MTHNWNDGTEDWNEIAKLKRDLEDADRLRERLATLLTEIAAVVKGPPPPDVMHDWSQLPRLVADMKAEVHDLAGRVQCLVNWADREGLLEEHVFTFPDGDTWHAT